MFYLKLYFVSLIKVLSFALHIMAFFTFLLFHSSAPAFAEGSYWIDRSVSNCSSLANGRTAVLAASTAGAYAAFCVFGGTNPAMDRKQAKNQCNKLVFGFGGSSFLEKTPCEVIWENEKIVNIPLYTVLNEEIIVPIIIDAVNGLNGDEIQERGYVTIGRSVETATSFKTSVAIFREDGTRICWGWIFAVSTNVKVKTSAICIEGLQLSGTLKLKKNLTKIGRYYHMLDFSGTIQNPPHKMQFRTVVAQ